MYEPITFFMIFVTFIVAGGIKGLVGLGLPSVSLGLLTVTLDLPTAMALTIAPAFITNAYQASFGLNSLKILLRIWPFILMATVTVWIGVNALTRVDVGLLTAILGFLLVAYGVLNLLGFCLNISSHSELALGLVLGAVNGILTGMTGSLGMPGVMYLQGIGLERDQLLRGMGMLFAASTIALAFALSANALLPVELGIASFFAVLPALIGMWIGQNLRQCLSDLQFRRVFFFGITLLGAQIMLGTVV